MSVVRAICAQRAAAAAGTHAARARAVRVADFAYDLPPERIALRPLPERSASRLLVAAGPSPRAPRETRHARFRDLPALVPAGARVVVNNSRAVPARVFMRRQSGARAEVFLLAPESGGDPGPLFHVPLEESSVWKCLIGGRRVRVGDVLEADGEDHTLQAEVVAKDGATGVVRFRGSAPSLMDALKDVGKTPLPPYIKRAADDEDVHAYQTVCSKFEGSVAAPTAGLHFTTAVLDDLDAKGVTRSEITLHVGAGTFLQIAGTSTDSHRMHEEYVSVPVEELARIADDLESGNPIVAVGTTSVRTLESMYWHGLRLLLSDIFPSDAQSPGFCDVGQWDPYDMLDTLGDAGVPRPDEALRAVVQGASSEGLSAVCGRTKLLIVPTYPFQIVDMLVTNFHQPKSTLLMLVAAFAGGRDVMFDAYDHALKGGYRFLSYGDSSLYFRG